MIYVANDHGGLAAKRIVLALLDTLELDYVNLGSDSAAIVRYPYYAARVAKAVAEKEADRGILICSTGIGMSIAANKYPGIRAALCTDSYSAKMTRLHNDSNILCLGGMVTGPQMIEEIVKVWLTTPFMGDRHTISLSLIQEMEQTQLSPQLLWEGENHAEYPWKELMTDRDS